MPYKNLPFDCCAISFRPFETPLCTSDGIVFDLPTAYYITAVEITDASIIGVLPRTDGEPEELGMLFEEGSPLVPCVNDALAALFANGTMDAIEDEWLNQGGSVPSLSN